MPEKNPAAPLYEDCPCRCCKKDDLCNKKPAECKPFKTWFTAKWRRICRAVPYIQEKGE